MKIKHLTVLLSCLIAELTFAQTDKPDTELLQLKGEVKSVNETTYAGVEKLGEIKNGPKIDRSYREFTKTGRELQFIQESADKSETENYVRTVRYENDKPVEAKENNAGKVTVIKFKYNQKGLHEAHDILYEDGSLMGKEKNKFNADGLVIQTETYKSDGSLAMMALFTYDPKKQLIKEEDFDENNTLARLTTYAYDSRGNLTEKSSVDYTRKQKKPVIYRYGYNEKGQMTVSSNSISGLDKKETYEYNAQGDVIRHVDAFGYEAKSTYTHDVQNNWIRRVTTRIGDWVIRSRVNERQIEYY